MRKSLRSAIFSFLLILSGCSAWQKELGIIGEVFQAIDENYLYGADFAKCRSEMLRNISPVKVIEITDRNGCLDKNSFYHGAEEAKILKASIAGYFGGIGIGIEDKNNEVAIRSVSGGGPADKAGMKAGDIIISVREENEKESIPISKANDAVKIIRGPAGTKIFINIRRSGNISVVSVTREKIREKTVFEKTIGRVGYIMVTKFSGEAGKVNTADELEDVLRKFREEGIKRAVLGFRNNPGGELDTALETLFILSKKESDVMLTIRYKESKEVRTIGNSIGEYVDSKTKQPKKPGEFSDFRIVLLINGKSASASEVVSGTMQDWGFTVVGESSYKKGSGQRLIDISDGSVLRLTVFEFFVGNGKRAVNNIGIRPDIEVKWEKRADQTDQEFSEEYIKFFGNPEKDPQLKKAIEILESIK